MTAHTDGPWFVSDLSAATMRDLGWPGEHIDTILILNREPRTVNTDAACVLARIRNENNPVELTDEHRANARLMAAAPDLLYAARVMLMFAEMYREAFPNQRTSINHHIDRTRAILAPLDEDGTSKEGGAP